MFERFRRYAPIPELAGRRAAPPMDLAQYRALFGRKENTEPKNIFICQHLFKKNHWRYFLSRFAGHFAQTH